MDLYQQGQIRRQATALRQTEENMAHRQRAATADLSAVEARLDRLILLCESMWELLCETSGLTPEHLAYKLHHLDMADGALDGKRQPAAADCSCGAKVNPKAKICMFCSAPAPSRSAFDTV